MSAKCSRNPCASSSTGALAAAVGAGLAAPGAAATATAWSRAWAPACSRVGIAASTAVPKIPSTLRCAFKRPGVFLWRGFCLLLARLLLLLLLDCRGGGAAGVASLRRLASSCSSPAACLASHAPASLPANLCSASSMPFLGLLPHLFLGSFPSRMRRTACSACLTYKCGLHLARWFFIRMCLNCSAASRCPLLPCCSARRCAYRSMPVTWVPMRPG